MTTPVLPPPPYQVDPTDPWYRPDLWAQVSELPANLVSDDPSKLSALEALEYASFVMFSLSGRKYRPVQTVTEIYDTRVVLGWRAEVYPALINGQVYNLCDGCDQCCCNVCGIFHRTRLRGTPVRTVTGVWRNGVALDPTTYMVLDNSVLAFTQIDVCNLSCLVVEYSYGTGVPPGGRLAVLKLATEMLNYAAGGECELPARVTSVSRQGLTWTLLDPQEFLKDGRTGVYQIDLFLRSVNPAGAMVPAKVFSPDFRRASVKTFAAAPTSWALPDAPGLYIPSLQRTQAYSRYSPLVSAVQAVATLSTTIDGVAAVDQTWTVSGTTATLAIDPVDQRRITTRSLVQVVDTGSSATVMTGTVVFL